MHCSSILQMAGPEGDVGRLVDTQGQFLHDTCIASQILRVQLAQAISSEAKWRGSRAKVRRISLRNPLEEMIMGPGFEINAVRVPESKKHHHPSR